MSAAFPRGGFKVATVREPVERLELVVSQLRLDGLGLDEDARDSIRQGLGLLRQRVEVFA